MPKPTSCLKISLRNSASYKHYAPDLRGGFLPPEDNTLLRHNREEFKIEDYDRTTTIPTEGDNLKTYKVFQRALSRVILSVALKASLFINSYNFSVGQLNCNISQQDKEFAMALGSVKEYFAPPTDLFTPKNLFKYLKFKLFEKSLFV